MVSAESWGTIFRAASREKTEWRGMGAVTIAEAVIDHQPGLHRQGSLGAKALGQAEKAQGGAYRAADPGSERHPDGQRAYLMGRVDQKQVSLFRRFADQRHLTGFEIAKPAMGEAGGGSTGPTRQVALVHEQCRNPLQAKVPKQACTISAAADDHDVRMLSRGQPFNDTTSWFPCALPRDRNASHQRRRSPDAASNR